MTSKHKLSKGATPTKISVVVPFYNASATLPRCLESLDSQNLPPVEVILVDNNSTDQSAEIAKKFIADSPDTFKYLLEVRQGPSFARNSGARLAAGDIIAFTDADCVPDPKWLRILVESFKDEHIGAVAGRVVGFKPESLLDKFHAMFTLRGLPNSHTSREFSLVRGGFPTANLAVRKDVFGAIGGFDESMKIYSEDYDLCARIYQLALSIHYTTDAVVYHIHRNSLAGTWHQSFGFGTGHAVLLKKHFKRLVIINLPRYGIISRKLPLRLWLDFAGADKKLLGIILSAFVWWPLSVMLIPYLLYLYVNVGSRVNQNGINTSLFDRWKIVFLLCFKSLALTAGRMTGSLRNRVMCF